MTVIGLLGIDVEPETPIFLGSTNIEHMRSRHPDDFALYFHMLEDILAVPDFVAKSPHRESIEYIKVLGNHVLAAVRLSSGGVWYARTLFSMSEDRVRSYQSNPSLMKAYPPKR